jgi:hypothetical protein
VVGFARVKYEKVYPGIDPIWHGDQQSEHDFQVATGAPPQNIRWQFSGARIEADGRRRVGFAVRPGQIAIAQAARLARKRGQPWEVECRYRLLRDAQVGEE